MNINTELLLMGISLMAVQWFGRSLPDDAKVIRELRKIIGEDATYFRKNLPPPVKPHTYHNSSQGFGEFFRYPMIIILVILVLCGLYFLIRRLSPYYQSEIPGNRLPDEKGDGKGKASVNKLPAFYRQALELIKDKRYKEAVIALHRATVEFLMTKVIIAVPGRKYTNNDLKRRIKEDKSLYEPFCSISNQAEIAGFSVKEICQSDCEETMEIFEKSFLPRMLREK